MTFSVRPTSKGQITLNKSLLAHLGVKPGDQLEVNILPGKRIRLARVSPKKAMSDLVGLLEPQQGPPVTDDQIEEGIAKGAVQAYLDDEADEGSERAA